MSILLPRLIFNHPSTKALRKELKESMRTSVLAELLILFINILRKGFINHSTLLSCLFSKDDLSLSLTVGVSRGGI